MTQSTSTEVRDAIAAANENFMAAFKRGDAAGMAALYTENGQVMPPNSDFVTGKQAVQMFWQALMDMGIKEAKLEIIEVEGHGDTAIEVSMFTLQGEGGQVLDKGKYIVIWKQEGGQWKLHHDIFNSSVPAPKPQRELAVEGNTVWVRVNHVKPDKREQFEHFVFDLFWGEAKRLSEEDQRPFRQTRVLTPTEPDEDGTYPYLFIMDPRLPGFTYEMKSYLVKMYGEEKAEEYLSLWFDSVDRPQTGYTVVQSQV